jgi:methanogenic corrinoid protein MtbC1
VPADSLAALVQAERPDLLALSVSLTFNLPGLRKSIAAVRQRVGPDLPIAAGGHAFTWDPTLPAQLGLAAHASDAEGLVEAVRRVFDGR